ncbi:chromate transporter [Methylopila sp. M107]|uniref:chromate efflux transporter n=1 Tax=Methylopila sp. M107 TaxID=1101190 RepID=UPI00035F2566|nr:chromate transporter [Methylopila sp. M107]
MPSTQTFDFDPQAASPGPQPPTLAEATRVWARIGMLSFGGPAGQIALMHRELVEQRRWIGEERFLHALNYCMLLPGPEAQQLATYVGWLMHRTVGGLIAGLLFVLPGALVMLGLSVVYALHGDAPLVKALFFGVKAAVLAVVVEALIRVGRRALKNRVMVAISVLAFIAIFAFRLPFPLIILAAGLFGWIGARRSPGLFAGGGGHAAQGAPVTGIVDAMFARGELAHAEPSRGRALKVLSVWLPLWLAPVAALWAAFGSGSVWSEISTFFASMAVVTFGGAYAVLSYVAQAAVESFGWLRPGEMADGLGLAETTPGPLIMVTQFVGFLAAFREPGALSPIVAGTLGALLTTWVTFAPSFLWIFVGGPYVEALRAHRPLGGALSAITAAVVGVIANLAVWFAVHTLFRETARPFAFGPDLPVLTSLDWRAGLLAGAAMVAMLRFKVGMLPTLAACAAAGLVLTWR